MESLRKHTTSILIFVTFLATWELATWFFKIPEYLLPSPIDAVNAFKARPIYFVENTWVTTVEALLGLLAGSSIAALIAISLYFYPGFEHGTMSIAITLKTMPMIAIAPLLTIWLGFGIWPKIIITSLVTFFPILINLLVGIRRVPAEWIELTSVLGADKNVVFGIIYRYAVLTYLFAGLRVAVPLAFIGAVVAEWTGASGGLGRSMWLSYANLELPAMFAAIFLLTSVSTLGYYLVLDIERRVIFWEPVKENE